ncbi:protein of unknown function [Cupriavidus taiwanensis]|nr:protein of unknown function [Cupriavidus taiwanensis]
MLEIPARGDVFDGTLMALVCSPLPRAGEGPGRGPALASSVTPDFVGTPALSPAPLP